MAEFRLSNFTSGTALTAAELNTGLTYAGYTPTWTQDVAITKTVNWARYTQFGKFVQVSIKMTATGAGTANNKILVGLPVNASANTFLMGIGIVVDEGATDFQIFRTPVFETASTVSFLAQATSASGADFSLRWGQTSGGSLAETIASGDILFLNMMYEAS